MHDGHPREEAVVATTDEANPAVRESEIGAQVEARLREMWQLPRDSRNDEEGRSATARFSVEMKTEGGEKEKEGEEGAGGSCRVDDGSAAYADKEWAALRALVERQGGDRAFSAASNGSEDGAFGCHQEATSGLAGVRLTCMFEFFVKVARCCRHRYRYRYRCRRC